MLDKLTVKTLPMEEAKQCCGRGRSFFRRRIRKCCSFSTVRRHVPIVSWLRQYEIRYLTSDMVAGFTIGLTIIPQSIAYANVAKLNAEYGLYAAFMGSFIYCIFGSTAAVNIGPTAIMGLLTSEHVKRGGPQAAILLCFYAGCIELLCGILHLGFLIDFISAPVISGFSSAAAIIISLTQLKGFLGINLENESLLGIFKEISDQKNKINYYDLGLGFVCMVLLIMLRHLGSIHWNKDNLDVPLWKRILRKSVWFLSAGRNALIVILASIMSYVMINKGENLFTLTGNVPGGLPPLQPPTFTIKRGNETRNELDSFKDFGSGLILVPLLAILEHIAIAKVFAKGKSLDSTQELISLGLANIAGSFVSSFPVTGSFSRTALNASCGVKTPMGGVVTGAIVLLALKFLSPSFQYIPKATLSAVIITAVIVMIEYRLLPYLWKTKKTDMLIMILTFGICIFFQVEYGILAGILASIMVLLYNTARPRITSEIIEINGREFILIRPDRMLNFPSVEYLRSRILKATTKNEKIPAILDGIYLHGMDYTVIQCVKDLIEDFKSRNQALIFVNLTKKVVSKIEILDPKGFIYFTCMEDLEAAIIHGAVLNPSLENISVISSAAVLNSLAVQNQLNPIANDNIQVTVQTNGSIPKLQTADIEKENQVLYLKHNGEESRL